MLNSSLGEFDYVVAMDSLIHYEGEDIARIVSTLAARTRSAIIFTVAPRTPALTVMHGVGRFFPRANRAPSIAPISMPALQRFFDGQQQLASSAPRAGEPDRRGILYFQAVELTRP